MKRLIVATLCLTLATAAYALAASSTDTFSATVPLLSEPPPMNGAIEGEWHKAVQIPVLFDFTYQREDEPTTVYVAQDAHALDVAFVVTQHAPLTENDRTNGAAVLNDDNVTVDLWPQGTAGFHYSFSANAAGARYQTSSENSAYAPDWTAAARRTPSGYVVTMRIPFDIMRSGGSVSWKAQFERTVQATGSDAVWEHVQGQRNAADPAFAGTLNGIRSGEHARRTQPRLQIYALGEATSPAYGGSTSRMGADLAVPVTPTSSFLASFHPDYSDVEIDQQTIAPSAFPHFYSEVRPFFTQLANNFNDTFSCTNCPTMLYTPAIPTFRQGYAYEGAQGPLNFAAFDAVGNARTDDAEALNYTIDNREKIESVALQRVAVHMPGFDDVTSSIFSGYAWQRTHAFVYLDAASDRGTNVTDPGLADYLEFGAGHVDKDTTYGIDYQKVGPQFLPADGFVQQPDVAGVALFMKHTIHYGTKGPLQDIRYNNFLNVQNSHTGSPSFQGDNAQINFDFNNQMTLHVFGGYGKNATYDAQYLPFNQNGLYLGYKTQTSTPSSILYAAGAYYHGSLRSWSYIGTLPVTREVNVALELDENTYAPGGTYASVEPAARQWLERASVEWQMSRYASFDLGVRRIIGRNLPNAFEQPLFDEVDAGNVSGAFHFLAGHNEWYVAYGNPNNLATLPALYVKWIRYIGAEKGT